MQLTEKAFAVVRALEAELAGERARGRRLAEDFEYNLGLLRERDALLDALETELAEARNDAETRALHADAARAENRGLRDDLTKARREIAELAQNLAEAQQAAQRLEQQAEQRLEQQAQQQAQRAREVQEAHQALQDRLIALERFEMQHGILTEQLEALRSQLEETRQRLLQTDEERKSAQKRVSRLDEETKTLREETKTLREALEEANENVARLRREVETRDEDLQRAVGKYKHDTRQLQEDRTATEEKLNVLRRRAKDFEKRFVEVEAERDALKQALTAEKRRFSALSDADEASRRQRAEREATLVELRDELATKTVALQNGEVVQNKLRAALALEQKEVQRLRERLTECEAETKEIKGGLKGANGNENVAVHRYKAIVGEMREEMETVARVMRELELERNGYKARLDTLALELSELRDEHARSSAVAAQLAETRRRLGVVEGENGELRARVALLTAGDPVEPETAALLRRLQASLREAIARLRELQTENERLGLSNRILKERLDALTGLPATTNATGNATANATLATLATGNATAATAATAVPGIVPGIAMTGVDSPSLGLSFDLSELPSGLSSLGDVSDLKERMRAALDNAGLLGAGV